MRTIQRSAMACLLSLGACNAKLDTQTPVAAADASQATSAGTENRLPKVPGAPLDAAALVGRWESECVANPSNSLVPGNVAVYEFMADGNASFRTYSYRDSLCEQRYTKADVDKLKTRLQAEARAAGGDLSQEELNAYEVLWLPPTIPLVYKLGQISRNGLVELDLSISNKAGETQDRFLSFYIEKGQLFFADVCAQLDAQLGTCGPVAGDKPENRGKTINFNVAYDRKPLAIPSPAP